VLSALLAGLVFFGAERVGYSYPWLAYALLGSYGLVTFLIIVFLVHRPLSKVFREMKALLTGRPYKRIFTTRIDEIGVLAHFFNDVTQTMERLSTQMRDGKRMSEELSIGSDIQRNILPKAMPQIPGLSIYGKTRPASEVGGDSFDIISAAKNNTLIYIGDVTGHGVPAGLIMVMVNMLIRTLSEIYASGYDILVNTNRLLKQRIEQRRFMTSVLLRWQQTDQKMFFTGCGHEHILIFRHGQSVAEVKQTGGIALGMVPDISKIIHEEEILFESGDTIILYSDGIVEAKNMQGEMYGLDRLNAVVSQHAGASQPEELFTLISQDFAVFVGEQIQNDDITLIVIRRV